MHQETDPLQAMATAGSPTTTVERLQTRSIEAQTIGKEERHQERQEMKALKKASSVNNPGSWNRRRYSADRSLNGLS